MANILIADDDITTQLILQDALEEAGYRVTTVNDGKAGWAAAQHHPPDLIICDWMMPEMDGLTLCQTIKADAALGTIFFILLTAREQLCDRVQGLDAGADDFLSKPVEIQELLARVRAGLRIKRLTHELSQANQRLKHTLQDLQQTQARLVQSEKMSSLGQMVAGLAHEINNPITFIQGNLHHLQTYVGDLLDLLDLYQQEHAQPGDHLREKLSTTEIDFIKTDYLRLAGSMQSGTERISQIIQSLRNFSHLDEAELKEVDLHSSLDNVLLMLQHRLQAGDRSPIHVIKQYGTLPLVECYARDLNQVFLNVLNNAIDALEQCDRQDPNFTGPTIWLQTNTVSEADGGMVAIRISNNGPVLPPDIKDRIFDPFFTTKPVGKGTGLGLAISHQIVTRHRGVLQCSSPLEGPTEFLIQIPARSQL